MVTLSNRAARRASKSAKGKAAAAAAPVSPLVALSSEVGFNYVGNRASARTHILACSKLPKSQMLDAYVQFKAGAMLSSIEHPTKALATQAGNYVTRRLHNLDRAARIAHMIEVMAQPAPDTTKPNRRTEFQHKIARAADSRLSELRREAGLTKTTAPKPRQPRPASNENKPADGASFSIAAPKFSSADDAREFYGNVAAALMTSVTVNQQPGAKKEAKGIAFRVSSAVADFKAAIEKALKD